MTVCIQRRVLGCSCALVVLAGAWSTGRGAEPFTEFLEGLRRRQLFDMAAAYLEQMQSSPLVSDEQKQTIPYELGRTIVEEARATRDTQQKLKRLDEARGHFDKFLKEHPQHPAAADAATQLGGLLVERGKTLLEIAKRPNQTAQKDELTNQARQLFADATKVFNDAQARFEEALKQFPKVIDPKDRKQLEARDIARSDVMRARLWSGMVLYESAKAYPPDSADAKRLLTESATRFEDMYKKNGKFLPGLYARLWQSRSLLELDETGKALLYLGELLVKPNTSDDLRTLRRKTMYLAMQGYLHEKEKKYDKAIEEGEKWLNEARGTEDRTPEGVAIRWYLAQGYLLRARALPEGDKGKGKGLSDAAGHAAQVAKIPGEFQKEARALVAELRDQEATAPEAKTFAEARTAGREALDEISALDAQIKTAQATHQEEDKVPAWQEQRTAALGKALDQFLLAMKLRDDETTLDQVNEVRYFIAYIYYLQERYYDGAVLGEFLVQRYPQHAQAKSAAKIALACWVKAYNELAADKRQLEVEHMGAVARLIEANFPGTPEANDAWMILGDVALRDGDLKGAAEHFAHIPADAPGRPEADLKQGQATWQQYLAASKLPAEERLPPEKLDALANDARTLLERGRATMRKAVESGGELTFSLLASELYLAQLYNGVGQYEPAIAVLELPNTGPLALAEAKNPLAERGNFSAEVWKAALRANVGLQRLEAAEKAMTALEQRFAGSLEGEAALTRLYVTLGLELEEQVARLQAQGKNDELARVLDGFKLFLDRILARQQGLTYNALNWVAETYFRMGQGLGVGADGNPTPQALAYYQPGTVAFQKLLEMVSKDPAAAANVNGVRVRLVRCQRAQGDFEGAMTQLRKILHENVNILDAQKEAAYTLQLWGGKDPMNYVRACNGLKVNASKPEQGEVWGWLNLARRIQRMEKYRPLYDEARYNVAECSYRHALSKQGADRTAGLAKVERMIDSIAQGDPKLGGEEWRAKYDRLLKQVQKATGKKADGLSALGSGVESASAAGASGAARTPPR
jgi:hypothetical protein